MNILSNLFGSTLGKKFIMALTGTVQFLFVVGHLVGNLQVFLAPEHINGYGHFLQSTPELLWGARIVLLACIGLHIWSAVSLTLENRAARPVGYDGSPTPRATSYASRTMMMSGLIVAAFIVYHLLHYTVCVEAVNFKGQDFEKLVVATGPQAGYHDVKQMIVVGFSNVFVSGFYVLGMALLCLHLSHGLSAMFQSLGLKTPAHEKAICCFARGAAILIFVGYVSIPLAVLLKVVQ